jgi:signal transduction histidine kinase
MISKNNLLINSRKKKSLINKVIKKHATQLNIPDLESEYHRNKIAKQASELIIAKRELSIHDQENEKRAEALKIANKELVFQNAEKEKRAEELIIANKELAFQNGEKEKRAAELIIANRELVFQNDEKEKRAAELIIANKELAFQNKEKEKRAEEYFLANKELEKAQEYQKEYIKGLEKMMFMTSHKVRQPITNILGLTELLDLNTNSPEELLKYLDYIKQSALALNDFTKDLTLFISELGKKCEINS